MSKFNVGDKVRYIGTEHDINPQWFPIVGTIGTIVQDIDEIDYYIQWPKGSTSKEDRWYCNKNDIKLVEDTNMTNEEIWEMVRPKMEKNGLSAYMFSIPTLDNIEGDIKWVEEQTYKANDVHNAIAIAYRSGYERAMKGRPFKIGEKQGSYWEWINPYEIVPNGTKVRYMKRAWGDDGNDPYFPKIGQECIKVNAPATRNFDFWVQFEGSEYEFTCFDYSRDCFQKWVEDDE